ncbi:uncharacterized protein IL334_002219 [Kwoniella shivajii]|uniref:ATP-dependent RNA helicase n=1 Tax=Kwoniella shivajii TaxID=564305 RepID=A0ABZ1CU40_9TREE|nr:hypothetical protein IL334_002219 [Kwoniella shivajii]
MSTRPPRGRGRRPARVALSEMNRSSPSSRDITTSQPPQSSDTSNRPRFRDFRGLKEEIFSALPFETCTEVQAATLPTILDGHDLLAQAKTGTGKTLAFLIPAIQHLLSTPTLPASLTSILILSPTRELAQQISEVAERMAAALGGRFGVKSVVGGTSMDKDVKEFSRKSAEMVVLDEADRLLDAGFRRELVKIFDHLPNRDTIPRQTLLFSATLPNEVHSGHKFITTLTDQDVNAHAHVKQETLVVEAKDIIPATVEALRNEEAKGQEFKGRTARAGAEGHGILVLGEFESQFLNDRTLQTFTLHSYPPIASEDMSRSRDLVNKALATVSDEAKTQAYQAWLGYYNSNMKTLKWSQTDLVRNANDYAKVALRFGPEPPGLLAKTVGKMGLKGVPGLNIVREVQSNGNPHPGKRPRDANGTDVRGDGGSRGGRGGGRGSGRGGGRGAGRGGSKRGGRGAFGVQPSG